MVVETPLTAHAVPELSEAWRHPDPRLWCREFGACIAITFQPFAHMAIINSIDALENEPLRFYIAIRRLPDELILHILWFLDIPDLYATSRVGSK